MQQHAKELERLLKCLANQNRLLLLCALMEKEMSVNELHEKINTISQPAISQHLAILEEQGCLQSKKNGQHVIYAIQDPRLYALFSTLKDHYCK